MTQLNAEKIAEILQRSPTAEAFATYAACRERNVRDGVSRLPAIRAQMAKEGFHPVPQDLLSMFRELERAGIGKLQGDQFKWSVSIKRVGEAIESPKPVKAESIPTSAKELVIFFDKNKQVEVRFPENLTPAEIRFVADKLLQEIR